MVDNSQNIQKLLLAFAFHLILRGQSLQSGIGSEKDHLAMIFKQDGDTALLSIFYGGHRPRTKGWVKDHKPFSYIGNT